MQRVIEEDDHEMRKKCLSAKRTSTIRFACIVEPYLPLQLFFLPIATSYHSYGTPANQVVPKSSSFGPHAGGACSSKGASQVLL